MALLLALAAEDGRADCPNWPSDLAASRETATAIAQAVVRGQPSPRSDFELIVREEGDHWLAFQAPRKRGVKGGGGLAFTIRKCDGAVRGIHRQK